MRRGVTTGVGRGGTRLIRGKDARTKEPTMSGQASEGMEAWMIAGSPGEHHKRLEPMVGSWKARVSWWAAPGAPPQVSDGAMTAEWILGGRFVKETFESYSPEMPFQGMGLYGYDNLRGKYSLHLGGQHEHGHHGLGGNVPRQRDGSSSSKGSTSTPAPRSR
jgi:hypothetical protein